MAHPKSTAGGIGAPVALFLIAWVRRFPLFWRCLRKILIGHSDVKIYRTNEKPA